MKESGNYHRPRSAQCSAQPQCSIWISSHPYLLIIPNMIYSVAYFGGFGWLFTALFSSLCFQNQHLPVECSGHEVRGTVHLIYIWHTGNFIYTSTCNTQKGGFGPTQKALNVPWDAFSTALHFLHTHTLTEGLFLFVGLNALKCVCFCLWCNVWRSPSAPLPESRCSRNISMSSTGARFVDSLNQRSGAEWEEKRQSVKEGKRKEAEGAPMCQECADASF